MAKLRPGQARKIAKLSTVRGQRDLAALKEATTELSRVRLEATRIGAALELVGLPPDLDFELSMKGAAAIQQFVMLCAQAIRERGAGRAAEMGDLLDRASKVLLDIPNPTERDVLEVVKSAAEVGARIKKQTQAELDRIEVYIRELAS